MKKVIINIIILAFLVGNAMPISASEMDSLYASEEIASQLIKENGDIVIMLYNGAFMYSFAEKVNVEDMLDVRVVYMVIPSVGPPSYYNYIDGQLYKIEYLPSFCEWSEFYKYAVYPEMVFEESVTVNDVYCLDGTPSHDGAYIYFKTSEGDFVLYKQYLEDEEEYLFPVEDLYGFAEAVMAERKANAGLITGGGIELEDDVFNVAPYRFKARTQGNNAENSWMLYALIIALGVTGIGGICIFARKKKDK